MGWSSSQACFAKADLSTWHLAQQSLCSFCLFLKLLCSFVFFSNYDRFPQCIPSRMCKEFGKHQVLNCCPFYLCGSREVGRFSGWNNDGLLYLMMQGCARFDVMRGQRMGYKLSWKILVFCHCEVVVVLAKSCRLGNHFVEALR